MTDPNQPILYPLLVRFAKSGLMRFVGHLDWLAMQHAIFLRAGLPLGVGEGPSHRLKIKTSPPTPVGVESMVELTYVLLSEPIYPDEAARRIAPHCPEGISVVAVKDAGFLVRKNPFGTVEAAGYRVEFGDGLSKDQFADVVEMLVSIKEERPPEGVEREDVKQFWERIIEVEEEDGKVALLADQREGVTFHGGKCATFLQERLNLPHYPLFTKLDYYRLKPSKRRLFR